MQILPSLNEVPLEPILGGKFYGAVIDFGFGFLLFPSLAFQLEFSDSRKFPEVWYRLPHSWPVKGIICVDRSSRHLRTQRLGNGDRNATPKHPESACLRRRNAIGSPLTIGPTIRKCRPRIHDASDEYQFTIKRSLHYVVCHTARICAQEKSYLSLRCVSRFFGTFFPFTPSFLFLSSRSGIVQPFFLSRFLSSFFPLRPGVFFLKRLQPTPHAPT